MVKLMIYMNGGDTPTLTLNADDLNDDVIAIVNECITNGIKFELSFAPQG